jgi:hypothetical protein
MSNTTTPKAAKTKVIPTISADIDEGMTTLTIAFSDGTKLEVKVDDLTPEIQAYAMFHGLKQKLVDAGAITHSKETGRSATLADKKNAVTEIFKRITGPEGSWNKVREGASASGGLLLRALCEVYPSKTVEQLREWLKSKTDDQKAALRVCPEVAAIIARLKLGAAKGAPDTDAMLAELDDKGKGEGEGEGDDKGDDKGKGDDGATE